MKTPLEAIRYFFCALGYFTRLPIPAWVGYRADDLDHAAKYFPLIGVLVGALGACIWWLAQWLFPDRVAILLSMIATVWLTGAFHEDGLADAIDGFGGGYKREDVLRIMQDSRIGSFGALSLALALLLKLELLASLPKTWLPSALIAAHAASRFAAVAFLATLEYARPEGKAKPVATRLHLPGLLLAAFFGLAPLALFGWRLALVIVLALALLHLLLRRYFLRRIGGYTGDALGFAQQLFELLFYGMVAAWIFI